MKAITVRDLQKRVRECVSAAQKDRVVITRHGRPAAIVIGVEGQDWEDIMLQTSPAFWRLIEARRTEETIPLAEARKRIAARGAPGRRTTVPRGAGGERGRGPGVRAAPVTPRARSDRARRETSRPRGSPRAS
jgi:prevent-host-death family protein